MELYHILREADGELLGINGKATWTLEEAQDIAYRLTKGELDKIEERESKECLAQCMSKLVDNCPESVVVEALAYFAYKLEII